MADLEPPIELHDVSVEFAVLNADMRSLQAQLVYLGSGGALKRDVGKRVTVSALEGIDLRADVGDRIGLIGRNGAGKSTLLRVLAGILEPTRGRVHLRGSISALLTGVLAVDEGVTGYQAIDYGGLLMGLPPDEIRRLKPEIAAFTELGDYLSMPVRTYSSGMKIRLQFGIATCYRPDILLVDEVIGAGDAHFVEKAKQRTFEFMESSSVMVLASHSNDIIHAICNKAVLMDRGRILLAGDVEDVLRLYLETMGGGGQLVAMPAEDARARGPRVISSGSQDGADASQVLDRESPTHWLSKEKGADVKGRASIGIDCGPDTAVEMRQFILRQWNGAALPNTVSAVLVQSSDDGFRDDIRNLGSVTVGSGVAEEAWPIPPSGPARFWRLLADSETAGGAWGVMSLEFMDEARVGQAAAGRPIASQYAATHGPSHLTDGFADTMWVSVQPGNDIVGKAFVGYDFGPNRSVQIHRIALRQWDGGARPNTLRSVKLQSSDDGFRDDIHNVDVLELEQGTRRVQYDCLVGEPARYWRLIANVPTGGGHWGVVDLELSDQPEPELDDAAGAARQPPGSAITSGDHLIHVCWNAFDGNPATRWVCELNGAEVQNRGFIGYDFGTDERVMLSHIVLQQWNSGAPPNRLKSVLLQCSDDGFENDVRAAGTIRLLANSMRNRYEISCSEAARAWRLVANSSTGPGGGRWGVVHLELHDEKARRAGRPPARLSCDDE